jgi:hypothetical protein
MRLIRNVAALGGGLLLAESALALRVAPGSPCEKNCGNVLDTTISSDITCTERSYSLTSNGIVFSNCVKCELTSPYSARQQTDTQWMLCMLAEPDPPERQCLSSNAPTPPLTCG